MHKSVIHYVSADDVVRLHVYILQRLGGAEGIRDLGLLQSAVFRPQSGMYNIEAYAGLHLKAAVLFHSLILNHPFVDGNKRTAILSMLRFLRINGVKLRVERKELFDLALAVATKELEEKEIANWIKNHV